MDRDVETTAERAHRALARAEAVLPRLFSLQGRSAVTALEREHDSLLSALAWFVERGDVKSVARMVRALREYWWQTGRIEEGQAWVARALAMPEANADTSARTILLDHGAVLALNAGDVGTAREMAGETVALRRKEGHPWLSSSLIHLAIVALSDPPDDAEARALLEEALTLGRGAGESDLMTRWSALLVLTRVAIDAGDNEIARAYLREAIPLTSRFSAPGSGVGILDMAAALAAREGAYERAWHLIGAAERAFGTIRVAGHHEAWLERWIGVARSALDRGARERAQATGRAMTFDQALEVVLAEVNGDGS